MKLIMTNSDGGLHAGLLLTAHVHIVEKPTATYICYEYHEW